MRLRPAVSVLAVLSFLLLAQPIGANAQNGFTQITVPKPAGVAFDPYSSHFFITQVGPPPGIQVWHQNDDGSADFEELIPLPADSDPGDIYYDSEDDSFIVQDHAKDRYFEVCPNCGSVTVHDLAVDIQFATGIQYGYNNWVMTDFGNGTSAGSLFYGPNFSSQLRFGDLIAPNGVALLSDGPVKHGKIPSEFLVIDAQNNDLVEVSDAKTPAVIGTEPGPPGAGGLKPPRDIAVDPVNLNSNPLAAATHLVLVPVPDLGNVYAARNGTGTWQPISSTPFGRPTRVAADCEHIGVTDFTNNVVTIFNEKPPKKAECEDIVDLIVGAGSGAPLTAAGQFKVQIEAFADGGGDLNASIGVGGFATKRTVAGGAGRAVPARKVTSRTKKVRLTAGRVTKVKLKFAGHARSALFAALQKRHKAVGTLTLRVKSPGGRKVKVKQRIRIRVAH